MIGLDVRNMLGRIMLQDVMCSRVAVLLAAQGAYVAADVVLAGIAVALLMVAPTVNVAVGAAVVAITARVVITHALFIVVPAAMLTLIFVIPPAAGQSPVLIAALAAIL